MIRMWGNRIFTFRNLIYILVTASISILTKQKKDMNNACPKAEEYVYILQTHIPSTVSMSKS